MCELQEVFVGANISGLWVGERLVKINDAKSFTDQLRLVLE